jgi:hypothetical protein
MKIRVNKPAPKSKIAGRLWDGWGHRLCRVPLTIFQQLAAKHHAANGHKDEKPLADQGSWYGRRARSIPNGA